MRETFGRRHPGAPRLGALALLLVWAGTWLPACLSGGDRDKPAPVASDSPPNPTCFQQAANCDAASGVCPWVKLPPGTACDDADETTQDDVCDADGSCAGTPYTCPPQQCVVQWTQDGDSCLPEYAPPGTECDDALLSTKDDACSATGDCVGIPYACDPQPCVEAWAQDGQSCVPTYAPQGEPCDDGDLTTTDDACDGAGSCGGTAHACNDPLPACVTSWSHDGIGCTPDFAPEGTACDDGDLTTNGDECDGAGSCVGAAYPCDEPLPACVTSWSHDGIGCMPDYAPEGTACDDGDLTTNGDECDGAGSCVGTAYPCDEPPPACVSSWSHDGIGCTANHAPEGTACDDGDLTTADDACDGAGSCVGAAYSCDEPLPSCVIGWEQGDQGCLPVLANAGTSCDDGDLTTSGDECDGGGGCQGTAYVCDDPLPSCVSGWQQDGSGCLPVFSGLGKWCDDGDMSTHTDECDGSGVCSGVAYACSPSQCEWSSVPNGVDCTVTFKDDGTACDDGDLCTTVDACSAGVCVGDAPIGCLDGHHCDDGVCVCGNLQAGCPGGFSCTKGESPVTPITHCLNLSGNEVYVPAGEFQMGCNEAVDDDCWESEYPQHLVDVPAFAIDRTEVTVSEYKACVASGKCTTPSTTLGDGATYDPADTQQHPINYMDWYQAAAFCSWRDKMQPDKAWRLCSEAEWEKAARGGCDLYPGDCASAMPMYPWGNEPPSCDAPALAVYHTNFSFSGSWGPSGCNAGATWPVGSKADGASPYGALDMLGNVREWAQDWYHSTYVGAPVDGTAWEDPISTYLQRVQRGGAYVNPAFVLGAGSRTYNDQSIGWRSEGIRCCRSFP